MPKQEEHKHRLNCGYITNNLSEILNEIYNQIIGMLVSMMNNAEKINPPTQTHSPTLPLSKSQRSNSN